MLCSLVLLTTALAAEPEPLQLAPASVPVNVTEPAANLRRKPDPYELDRPDRRVPLWVVPIIGGAVAGGGGILTTVGFFWPWVEGGADGEIAASKLRYAGLTVSSCGGTIAIIGGTATLIKYAITAAPHLSPDHTAGAIRVTPLVSPTIVGVQGRF